MSLWFDVGIESWIFPDYFDVAIDFNCFLVTPFVHVPSESLSLNVRRAPYRGSYILHYFGSYFSLRRGLGTSHAGAQRLYPSSGMDC